MWVILSCCVELPGDAIVSASQHIYNIYFQPPKQDGVCDLDGSPLIQRADDTEKVFEERMRNYESQTAPVIEHYRALAASRK